LGQVFGGFISDWNTVGGGVPSTSFFGSGECFLFQVLSSNSLSLERASEPFVDRQLFHSGRIR
jgi:hypothetical protein